MTIKFSHWHVNVAAEAFAAALFARYGFDVSVQYGANQPEYDLIIAHGDKILKVDVKGSQTGRWGLTQGLVKNADYHAAADKWLKKHNPKTILCFVQFKGIQIDKMPRVYIATPAEVAEHLKATANGRGSTVIYELRLWGPRAFAAGVEDRIPEKWLLSEARINELLETA